MNQSPFEQSVLAVEYFLDNQAKELVADALDAMLDGLNTEELSSFGMAENNETTDFVWKSLAARAVERGKLIPTEYAQSVKEALGLGANSRVRSAGRPTKTPLLVFLAMLCAIRPGVLPTRNETSDANSACDAVALAFRRRGMTPNSYSGVKAAWVKARQIDGVMWTENAQIKSP